MKIYTSYFAIISYLPSDLVPIAICGKSPEWYVGLEYKKLAPKYKFFMEWKKTKDNDFYVKHFNTEVLDYLNADEIVKELEQMSDGKDVVLLCYEKPDEFCHRHLVAEWLNGYGYPCTEIEIGVLNYK